MLAGFLKVFGMAIYSAIDCIVALYNAALAVLAYISINKMFHTYPSSTLQYGNGNRLIWYGQIDVPYIVAVLISSLLSSLCCILPCAYRLEAANLNLSSINKCAVALSLKCYYYCGLFV